ncbi:MAG: hypothetical protein DMF68_12110 [Acidobacteria bacterium]|nr:MAG: hypothetical protein DMF68_12110 [Acidobacteriota bacterium]
MWRRLNQKKERTTMKKFFALSLTFALCSFLTVSFGSGSSASNQPNARQFSQQKSNPGNDSSHCPSCAHVGAQTIYAPIIELPESSGTEINLNCRSPHAVDVTPTFYTKKGEAFVGSPFQMQPAEVKTVDLKTLMPAAIRNRHDMGGMTLSYTGHILEMWGQLRLLRVGHGNSVDVLFANLSDNRSSVRNAVWSTPEHSSAVIVIGNAGATPTKAVVQFSNGDSQQVEIPSFGTELIRRHAEQHGANSASIEAEGATVTAADGSGNLIFAGAVVSDDGSFTSSIRFYDTVNVVQQNLFATNFRLRNVKPLMLLRNTGTESILATPRFRPVSGDANNFIDLAGVTLSPNEIAQVDLSPLVAAAHDRSDFDNVSIEVMNTGQKGSLVGALNGTDETTGLTYDVPLRDIGALRGSTGSYPWRLDGDVSTIASITNVAPVGSEFVVQINYPGGHYLLNPRKLAAGATATFDLRKLRDEQIPDSAGHTIPLSVNGGQFRWFIHGAGSGRLIGRVEMLSLSRGISSSYSCNDPCPPGMYNVWLDPGGLILALNEEGGETAWEMDSDSYGNHIGPFSPWVAGWYCSDTSVVDMEDNGTYADFTGLAPGTAFASATINYEVYVWDGMECIDEGMNQTEADGEVGVRPVISGPHTMWWFNGENPSGYATQITLSTTSDATSWHWQAVSGASKVSLSNEDTDTVTITSTGRSDNPNDVGIQVSVNGQVSDQFNITILAPYRFTYVTEGHAPSNNFGYISLVQYEIRDQFGSLLPSNVPINEHFTTGVINDYSGTNWIRDNREGGTSVPPSGWSDEIDGQPLSRNPFPIPTAPCSPLCNTPVHHFNGEWRVGSTTAGAGVLVQTNTWYRYVDHGTHTNKVSPVP